MSATVTVRYWAGARRAAGVEQEQLVAATVGDLREQLGGRPELATVSKVAAFLVDGLQAGDATLLHEGAEVDVLPPFAGGSAQAPVLRDATDDDAAAVAEIYGHYVRDSVATFDLEPRTVEQWRTIWAGLRESGWPCVVAELDNVLVGFAYVGPYRPKPAYRQSVESTVYLAPERTGAGLGSLLMKAVLQRAASNGARQVVAVIADTGDPSSKRLHERLGFVEVGTLRGVGHKLGRDVDTLIMQLALET